GVRMNRRDFTSLIVGSAISTLSYSRVWGQQAATENSISPQAAELYRRALVLDCNSGPPGDPSHLPLPQSDLDMVRSSGINVVKLSIGGINADFHDTVSELAIVQRVIETHPAYFMQVRTAADLESARRDGKLGIICSFESADMFEGKIDRIGLFRDL